MSTKTSCCACGRQLQWWQKCANCVLPKTMEEVLRQQYHNSPRKLP